MSFVQIVLASLSFLQLPDIAAAGRTVVEVQEHKVATGDGDCACYKQLKCSSCSFKTCPYDLRVESGLHVVSRETPFGTRKWHAKPVDAAWQVRTASGHTYVLRFGGSMAAPVKAAQLAHALDVDTPRIFTTDSKECPSLFKNAILAGYADIPTEFSNLIRDCMSLSKLGGSTCPFSVQEWGKGLNADHLSTPWYKAGGVAVLDWLIGKCNLFNDVPLDFQETGVGIDHVQKFNAGNLIVEDKSVTDINLNNIVDTSACRWDLWQQALQDFRDLGIHKSVLFHDKDGSSYSEIPWVRKVVIPVLTLVKADSATSAPFIDENSEPVSPTFAGLEHVLDRTAVDVFGKFSLSRVQGYEPFLSPLLVQLGMVDTLMRADALFRNESTRFLLEGMPGIQAVEEMPWDLRASFFESFGEIRAKIGFEIDDRFRALGVRDVAAAIPPPKKEMKDFVGALDSTVQHCCQVKCRKSRARTKFNWRLSEPCDAKTVADFKPQAVKLFLNQTSDAENENFCENAFKERSKEELLSAALKCIPVCGLSGEVWKVNLVDLLDSDQSHCQ